MITSLEFCTILFATLALVCCHGKKEKNLKAEDDFSPANDYDIHVVHE